MDNNSNTYVKHKSALVALSLKIHGRLHGYFRHSIAREGRLATAVTDYTSSTG